MHFEQTKNLIGRIWILAIFIYAIPSKLINFERDVKVISNRNIPQTLAPFLLVLAITCLAFGAILFISGFKQRLGAYLLLISITSTTFILHFSPFQIKFVLMNAGIIGGLILGLGNAKSNSLKEIFNTQTNKNN